jgi:hypothetical protein
MAGVGWRSQERERKDKAALCAQLNWPLRQDQSRVQPLYASNSLCLLPSAVLCTYVEPRL